MLVKTDTKMSKEWAIETGSPIHLELSRFFLFFLVCACVWEKSPTNSTKLSNGAELCAMLK